MTCSQKIAKDSILYLIGRWGQNILIEARYSPVYVSHCRNIYYIFGQVQQVMFASVNFLIMFNAFGHNYSVILNRSSDRSVKQVLIRRTKKVNFQIFCLSGSTILTKKLELL